MAKYYLKYNNYISEAMYDLCVANGDNEQVVFYGTYANCIDYMLMLMKQEYFEVNLSEQFLTKKVNKYVKKERIA